MHRRHYLAVAGTALTAAVAGCSSSDGDGNDGEPTDGEPTDGEPTTGESTTEEPPANDTSTPIEERGDIEDLRAELADREIDIYDLFRDDSYIVLDYFTQAESETDEALDEEIVATSRAFAAVVDDFDQGLETMECLALLNEGEFLDQFDIQAEWARDYAAGDLSDEEYTQNVVDTLEYR